MIRTRIQLEPERCEGLEELAAHRSKSFAHLAREGADQVLATEQRETAWGRLLAAAGSCRAGDDASDVSARHDAYLSDAFANE